MKTKINTALCDVLSNGLDVHRSAAARALGKIGSKESIATLIKALLDEDPDIRTDAATSLGELGATQSGEALMENLIGDQDSDVKKAALLSLISIGHQPVVPLLRKLVISKTDDIAWDEDEFYAEEWDSWVDMQLMSIRGLGELGADEGAAEILTAMADEMGQDVSEAGLASLSNLGELGVLALQQLYDTGDAKMRRRIARAVIANANPNAEDLKNSFLADEYALVRKIAVRGFAADSELLEPLFGDKDASVRAEVIAYAGMKFPQLLGDLVNDDDPDVRIEVFKTIAANPDQFGDEELAKSVQEAIAGEPAAAKHAAMAWIALKGPDGIKGLKHVMTSEEIPLEFRMGVIEAMKMAGDTSVPYLLAAAGDENRRLRLATLEALVGFAADNPVWPNDAGTGLLAALNGELVVEPEDEDEIEETAQDAINDPDAAEEEAEVDDTLPLIPEGEKTSTLDVILSVGKGENEEVIEPQPIQMDESQERLVEKTKLRSMSNKKISLETIIAPHIDVRRFAARLLGGVVNGEVTENLIASLASDDKELQDAALISLVQHGEKIGSLPESANEPVFALLGSLDPDTKLVAVRALGWLQGDDVDARLIELLSDSEDFIRTETVRVLDRRGIADENIVKRLKDRYRGVGIVASNALARHRGPEVVNELVDFAIAYDGTYRHDIGKLLGEYAPNEGATRLLEILGNEAEKRSWLVAIDALAEIYQHPGQSEELKVA